MTGGEVDPMADVTAMAADGGVDLRPVETAGGHHEVAALFRAVWQALDDAGPVGAGTMRAAQHVGAYVVGAHALDPSDPSGRGSDPSRPSGSARPSGSSRPSGPSRPARPSRPGDAGGAMVGASFGFHGSDGHLHSHVTGIHPDWQGRGLGRILKLHQRAWCLERGVETITWTFDPLVRRNAWFNLRSLGAEVTEYLPSFYGPMTDGINAGDDTDRAFVVWRLPSHRVRRAISRRAGEAEVGGDDAVGDGAPAVAGDDAPAVVAKVDGVPVARDTGPDVPAVRVALPPDIEAIRTSDHELALSWRRVVRDAIVPRLAAGWRIATITTDGSYLLEAP